MAIDIKFVLVTGGIGLAYLIYCYIVFPAFLSPLSRIPTPHWSCSFSDIWINLIRNRGLELQSLYEAHLRLGDVVRVGPKTLNVNGPDAIHTVYQGGFKKTSWYPNGFNIYGYRCLMSSTGNEHVNRRRMIANVFSKSYIQSSKSVQGQLSSILFDRLLPHFSQEAAGSRPEGIEIQAILLATSMDVLVTFILGLDCGVNFIQDLEFRKLWFGKFESITARLFWIQEYPRFTKFCSTLGIWLYGSQTERDYQWMLDWNMGLCNKAFASMSSAEVHLHDPANEPVVFQALHGGFEAESTRERSPFYKVPRNQRHTMIATEVLDQLMAGQDPGACLIYIFWKLSEFPDVQDQLREELLSLPAPLKWDNTSGQDRPLPDFRALDALPILNAVVLETLRLFPPVPPPEPRETPYPSCQIGGFNVPGGVRVAATPYIVHRNESAFPDALVWDHARWLNRKSSQDDLRCDEMDQHFWPWSSGKRVCLAQNFALNQVKFITAGIYTNFKTSIVDDSSQESTYTSIGAHGDGLYLKVEPV